LVFERSRNAEKTIQWGRNWKGEKVLDTKAEVASTRRVPGEL